MALDLLNLFRALAPAARAGYLIASGEAPKFSPFDQLAALPNVNPAWAANVAQSYDSNLRVDAAGFGVWQQVAQAILQGIVAADDPFYGSSVSDALGYLVAQMKAQSATVKRCVVGSVVTADAANVGTGVVFVTTTRQDGVPLENTVAEVSTLLVTADSYTGSATAGREPWRWSGAANVSSLGTGVPVGATDFDSPTGSGASAGGACVSADEDANTAGNLLTNGDFESWTTGGTPILNNWHLTGGTWGTDVVQDTTHQLAGTYSLKFVAGTGTTESLTQQFGSAVSDGTLATAGTAAVVKPLWSEVHNIWLRADGVVTAGRIDVELVDGSGTVINDQAGTPNTFTINLAVSVGTSYAAHPCAFRLPAILPPVVRLRLRVVGAITGANVYADAACFAQLDGGLVNTYPGGPNVAVFSNPAVPFEAVPDPDGFTLTFTNDRGGASYGATWQTGMNRLFGQPYFLAPSGASPTIPDTLINAGVPRLLAYYPINGHPAGLLSDASGNVRDLTPSSPVYAVGKFWSSLSSGTQTWTGTFAYSALSLSFWFKFNSASSFSLAGLSVQIGSGDPILELNANRSADKAYVYVNGANVAGEVDTVVTQVWHHLAAAYDPATGRLLVWYDGRLIGSTDNVPTGTVAFVKLIGGTDAQACDGAVFLDPLVQAEVSALYAGGPLRAGRPVLPYPP